MYFSLLPDTELEDNRQVKDKVGRCHGSFLTYFIKNNWYYIWSTDLAEDMQQEVHGTGGNI